MLTGALNEEIDGGASTESATFNFKYFNAY